MRPLLLSVAALAGGCDQLFGIDAIKEHDPSAEDAGMRTVTQLAAGGRNACVLLDDDSVWCWGQSAGVASTVDYYQPRMVIQEGAIAIAAGDSGVCTVFADHTAKCWGGNYDGALGIGASGRTIEPSPILEMNMQPATDVAAVAIGNTIGCVLRTDGRVSCAGSGGRLGDGSTTARTTLGGDVTGITDAKAIVVGDHHACALRANGTAISCWGDNRFGQTGAAASSTPVGPVTRTGAFGSLALGDYFTCALNGDGTVSCWGDNRNGALGDASTTSRSMPASIAGLADVSAIAAGAFSGYAISGAGVHAWGDNTHGQLGDGSMEPSLVPVTWSDPAGLFDIHAGTALHACARSSTAVWCWGNNEHGQLGDTTILDRVRPVEVVGLPLRRD